MILMACFNKQTLCFKYRQYLHQSSGRTVADWRTGRVRKKIYRSRYIRELRIAGFHLSLAFTIDTLGT